MEFMKYQKGETNTYLTRVTAQVEASKAIAEAEGVVVPTTVEDYCISSKPQVERIDSMESDVYGDDDCPSGTYHLEYYLQRVIYLPATMIFIRHRIFCAPSSVPPLSPPSPRPLPALSGFLLFSFFCAFFGSFPNVSASFHLFLFFFADFDYDSTDDDFGSSSDDDAAGGGGAAAKKAESPMQVDSGNEAGAV